MAEHNDVVLIELDRVRELRFGHKAMKRWSAYTGKPISSIDTDNFTPEQVEILLFFMLEADAERHGEKLEMSQMEDLLDLVQLGVVYQKLSDAMESAFTMPASGKNAKRAAAGTGSKV